ncbi:clathrin adaptor, mu subunit [Suhomyces tanzawaensis NRRL Y-17324]|uniref:Clathrin adaptor, mu subunit n=1 Tax=Suhomyces tanzawaensis NRRL Y-17324 TaxID=984487 RepID=A0A1E4SHB8_9ASCO|nr:clathrin adaptor, mu subunit [Suhomyces tanzawaensis NRRL Y-17324]ODV78901.1 clathrin adaptor, mu subunit [Suhomyces tanzawaensis NRRL Y-17324]
MFEAVYIADINNNLVFEYLINLSSPKFKSLTPILSQAAQNHDQLPLIEINPEYFIVFEKTKNLLIYVLCSNESHSNPLMPLIFIQRLLEVMSDYFGTPLALTKIDANNDTLTLLINEMLDDGTPNTTDFNKLRELIPSKSFLSQLLSTSNELASSAAAHVTKSHMPNHSGSGAKLEPLNTIPWRRSNVKYTNNEMYVDIIETVNVILKPAKLAKKTQLYSSNNHFDSAFYSSLKASSQMVPISGHILGQINFISHLTGVPLLQLLLSINGLDLQLPSFHKCIEVERWLSSPGTLSFIPADGKSVLMNYEIDLDSAHRANDLLGLISVDYRSGLGVSKNEFEVKLIIDNVKAVSKIEDMKVEIFCEEEGLGEVTNVKSNRITHGDFTYKGKGHCEWNLRTVNTGILPLLQGTIITSNMEPEDSRESTPNLIAVTTVKPIRPEYVKLTFNYKGSVPSGLKVDSLKVVSAKGMGDTVKPYKGVKYITRSGDFVIRS